jgi:hypothetical protein
MKGEVSVCRQVSPSLIVRLIRRGHHLCPCFLAGNAGNRRYSQEERGGVVRLGLPRVEVVDLPC